MSIQTWSHKGTEHKDGRQAAIKMRKTWMGYEPDLICSVFILRSYKTRIPEILFKNC